MLARRDPRCTTYLDLDDRMPELDQLVFHCYISSIYIIDKRLVQGRKLWTLFSAGFENPQERD